MRPLLFFLFLVSLASCKNETRTDRPELAEQVTIYRDTWGVPHVVGETDEATMFGYGYARAEDDFERLEKVFIKSLGRGAEFYGEALLKSDYTIHALEIPEIAQRQFDIMDHHLKKMCIAYVDGLNYFLELHPNQEHQGLEIEPWMMLTLQKDWWVYILELTDWEQQLPYTNPMLKSKKGKHGSNSWALGPSKTKKGSTMLLVNPHMPSDAYEYEVHLFSQQGLNIYGGVANGSDIFPTDGFNEHIAWSQTTNFPDQADVYKITFDHPSDTSSYKYGGEYLRAKTWEKAILIKEGVRTDTVSFFFRKTIHGPVLKDSLGHNLSYRIPEIEHGNLIRLFYNLAQAKNMTEWKIALKQLDFPYENMTCIDDQGNFGYVYNARIPRRDPEVDWSEVQDGSDPNLAWQGYHSFEELPQLWNPETGYVQNCNSSPFQTTHLQNPDSIQYPDYFTPDKYIIPFRANRYRNVLKAAENLTLDEAESMIMDTYLGRTETRLPLLFKEFDSLKSVDVELYQKLSPLIDSLKAWDRYSYESSVATTLFTLVMDHHLPEPWSKKTATNTMVESLNSVKTLLENEFDTWKVPYGKIIRHQRRAKNTYEVDSTLTSYPTNGNHGEYGSLFSMAGFHYNDTTLVRRVESGNTLVMLIEQSSQGPEARSILNYGQSAHPDSPHYNDQAEMFAKGEMKKVNFKMEDILNNLESQYKPGEEINNNQN